MKKLTLLFIILLMFSCDKADEVIVKYSVSDNNSGFRVNYLNEAGQLITEEVEVSSAQDIWSYSYSADRGQIIFISAIYNDINDEIKVALLIDGKTFKQGYSKQDTVKYVTVSGTVPYK